MFGPDYTAGCPSCSAIADGFNGFAVHLANHDVMLWAISRAPLAKLQAFRQRMGWTFPWASSFDSDFNWDFAMSLTEEQQREGGTEYNYRRQPAYTPPKGSGPNIGARATSKSQSLEYPELALLLLRSNENIRDGGSTASTFGTENTSFVRGWPIPRLMAKSEEDWSTGFARCITSESNAGAVEDQTG
jgi:predicted dithiol-disulfide oxidoreductase (DUF899 family)